jgi:hypothetical protein
MALTELHPSPTAGLPVPRPVDRYDYVRDQCVGQRVLDLGAYDETEFGRHNHSSWRWLHAEIAGVAKDVLGVDAAEAVRLAGGVDTPCGTRIVYGTVERLGPVLSEFEPDVIVAGELIEHTPDTLGWISRVAAERPGIRFIATTPNTTSMINILLALVRRENAHPDHLHVYSYRTLYTLAGRVPVHDMRIVPYYYNRHMFYERVPRWATPAVTAADILLLKPLQYLFPLTSMGLILDCVLGAGESVSQEG